MADVTLKLTPSGETVEVSTLTYLGGKFPAYRDAVAGVGGIYKGGNLNSVATAQVPELLELFDKAKLTYSVDATLAEKFRSEAEKASEMATNGADWITGIDAKLAARGLALYPFQRSGIRWLHVRKAALLCDEMGLGKTNQALLSLPERAAALAVVPAAVVSSWRAEAEKWRPDLFVTVLKGKSGFRWPRPGELLIATYGILPGEGEFLPAPVAMHLIADEAHLLKNAKTARGKNFARLRDTVKESNGSVFLLTGTPLLNRPDELWQVLGAAGLQKSAFGSWPRFCAMFSGHQEMIRVQGGGVRKVMQWGGSISPEAPLALQKVSLHRRRLDVLPDLPTKTRVTRYVEELPAGAMQACDAVVAAMAEKGIDLNALPPGADLGKMISGPVFELMSRARAQLATAKIPTALEFVEEYEEQETTLVVVSAHREPVETIGARPGWAFITGETPNEERGRIAARFQAGDLKGLAFTYKAGGVGITLTYGAHMLLVDLDWTPALIQQAEDRLCRIGQKNAILVTRLVARHALDERVTELLTEKQRLIEQSVEASAVSGDHEDRQDIAGALQRAAEQAAKAVVAAPVARPEDAPKPAPRGGFTPSTIAIGCSQTFGAFRPPKDEAEVRTARALLTLAAVDLDRASVVNGMGFNKLDGDFGHSLAKALGTYGRLSEKQWAYGEKLVRKYHGQVGDILSGTQSEEGKMRSAEESEAPTADLPPA